VLLAHSDVGIRDIAIDASFLYFLDQDGGLTRTPLSAFPRSAPARSANRLMAVDETSVYTLGNSVFAKQSKASPSAVTPGTATNLIVHGSDVYFIASDKSVVYRATGGVQPASAFVTAADYLSDFPTAICGTGSTTSLTGFDLDDTGAAYFIVGYSFCGALYRIPSGGTATMLENFAGASNRVLARTDGAVYQRIIPPYAGGPALGTFFFDGSVHQLATGVYPGISPIEPLAVDDELAYLVRQGDIRRYTNGGVEQIVLSRKAGCNAEPYALLLAGNELYWVMQQGTSGPADVFMRSVAPP
jgi:hypothetical protein